MRLDDLVQEGAAIPCDKCGQIFAKNTIGKHAPKCQEKKQQEEAEKEAARINNDVDHVTMEASRAPLEADTWKANAKWDLITMERLEEITQPGLACFDMLADMSSRRKFARMIKEFYNAEEATAGKKEMLMFFFIIYVLHVPSKQLEGNAPKLKHAQRKELEKGRIEMFVQGNWQELHLQVKQAMSVNQKKMIQNGALVREPEEYIKKKIARGNVADALNCKQIWIIPDETAVQKIRQTQFSGTTNAEGDEHTSSDSQTPENTTPTQEPIIDVSDDEVSRVFRNMSNIKGKMGTSVSFWAEIHKRKKGLVTMLVSDIVNGRMNPQLTRMMSSVNFKVIQYIDKDKYRIVGSVDGLMKVAQQVMISKMKEKISDYMKSTPEASVGKMDGMATAISKAQEFVNEVLASEQDDEDPKAVLALDLKAAYPNTPRKELRQVIAEKFPELGKICDAMWGGTNMHHILTTEGVVAVAQNDGIIQGAELSPFLFALLSLQPMMADDVQDDYMKNSIKYQDDVFLFGKMSELKEKMQYLSEQFGQLNLQIQPQKCKLYVPGVSQQISKAMSDGLGVDLSPDGLHVLGAPVGNERYIEDEFKAIADDFLKSVEELLPQLSHQQAYIVLKNTPSAFQHLLAVCKPELVEATCAQVDERIQTLFLERFFDEQQRHQLGNYLRGQSGMKGVEYVKLRMQLPIKVGGFGILSLQSRAKAAYTVHMARVQHQYPDVWNCFPLASRQHAESLKRQYEHIPVNELYSHKVNQLLLPVHREQADRILAVEEPRIVHAFQMSRQQGAGTIFSVRPKDIQRTFDDFEMKALFLDRLDVPGIDVVSMITRGTEATCPECQNEVITTKHINNCPCGRHARHDTLKFDVLTMCAEARASPVLEPIVSDDNQMRVDIECANIYAQVPNLRQFTKVGLDVTVTHVTEYHGVRGKIQLASKNKNKKYAERLKQENKHFVPLAITSRGYFSEDFTGFIRQAAHYAYLSGAYVPGIDENFVLKWKQRMVCGLHRSMCTMMKKMKHHIEDQLALEPTAPQQSQ